jgi:hypothetical protein
MSEDSSILKRRYFRNIPSFIFPQILSCDLMKEPEVIRKYYPLTDELLLALHWPAPERRLELGLEVVLNLELGLGLELGVR